MSTLQATNLKHNASASNNIVLDSSGNATFAGTAVPSSSFLRNRIINGDMRIDQRNAGASVTPVSGQYLVDRWRAGVSAASKYSVQQNAGSVGAPTGFSDYLGATSLSAYALGSGDIFFLNQRIEGFNTSDLGFGTASASTITVSFWVRSSLTGTHCLSVVNAAFTRSYVATYTISAANTWERKSITIPGDTSGTWVGSTNGIGMGLVFNLGAGTTYQTTANTWASGEFYGVSGAVSVVSTNGATFYLTGVQLEVGSVATPFERRQFGQELALCQRYFQRWDFTPTWGSAGATALVATKYSTTDALIASIPTFCPFRVAPTVSVSQSTARAVLSGGGGTVTFGVIATNAAGNGPITISATNNSVAAGFGWLDNLGVVSASAEL